MSICLAKIQKIISYHEDFSGKHHDFVRPEMKKIRDYCKKHKREVDLILFLRWDRFSRNPEFAYMFKRMFLDDWGIEFNAIESPIDFGATEWSLLLSSYCAAAHTENNKISRRTRDGVRETLLSGRLANKAPRGYKNVHITDENGKTISKTVEIDEGKAPLIRTIFNEVAKGIEAPCAIRRRIAPDIPESTFLDMLRINLIDNIDRFFQYAPAEAKIKALSSIFPEKIEFDGNNFRTVSMNSVITLIYQQTNELRGLKNKNEESFSTFPASVPGAGVEGRNFCELARTR